MLSVVAVLGTVLAAAAMGQACLTASLLAVRKDPRGIYRPLLTFFVAFAVAKLSAVVEVSVASSNMLTVRHVIDLASILAYTLVFPAIWIYVRALTSESPLQVNKGDAWHLSAFIIGLAVAALLLSSSTEVRHHLIGDGDGTETPHVIFLTVALLMLMFTWITQAVIYVVKIMRRLTRYRARLKDLFASTQGRELHWISWVVTLLAINVLIVVIDMFVDVPPRISIISDTFDLGMIWILSVWGLRVTPSIEGAGAPLTTPEPRPAPEPEAAPAPKSAKYEKSALTPEHMARISDNLDHVMRQQKLYLEPSLSLRDLAKAISTPPNYVSQTLNSQIGETFFDYVNSWRIKDAIPMLVGCDEPILNIVYDVGYNSRSSFYKAFKRETGMTPSAYRTMHTEEKPDQHKK